MSDLAWAETRDLLREARLRCLTVLARAFGCEIAELPRDVARAVVVLGHESYQIALQYAHERDTLPAPPRADSQALTIPPPVPESPVGGPGTIGTYHEQPITRVDRLHPSGRGKPR